MNVFAPARLLTEIIWAADNGCFSSRAQGASFTCEGFLRFLDRWAEYTSVCLFVVTPDVPVNHDATVERSTPYSAEIRSRGYVPALAIQEGATYQNIPLGESGAVVVADSKPGKDEGNTRLQDEPDGAAHRHHSHHSHRGTAAAQARPRRTLQL